MVTAKSKGQRNEEQEDCIDDYPMRTLYDDRRRKRGRGWWVVEPAALLCYSGRSEGLKGTIELQDRKRRAKAAIMEIRRTGMLLWVMGGLLLLLLVWGGLLDCMRGAWAAQAKFGEQCPGRVWEGKILDEDPRFVSQDQSGERYDVGENGDTLPILHLYGSPFELGRAHGTLLRVEIQSMYLELFRHMENEWISALHLTLLPDIVARKIARLALNAALDATYLLSLQYLPGRFVDEMLGLSQGAEVDYQDVVRIQMVPELFQASCSMLGSWGPATTLTPTGGLYQMRALDWDVSAPLLDYHAVINFHPSDGNSFAILTWTGFIGCISGYSGRLGVSEKAWEGYNGTGSHRGMPWHFVLRDVLQFTKNLEGAWNLLMETPRTCPILVGIGSLEDDKFVLLGYSADVLELHDDSNFTMITSVTPGHNESPGVIFVDKYEQPSDDKCMGSIVQHYYGRLDETSIMDMVSRQQTGVLHTALYDFIGNNVYFSWAIKSPYSEDIIPAYRRNFLKLNMSSLLLPQPRCTVTEESDVEFDYCMLPQRDTDSW